MDARDEVLRAIQKQLDEDEAKAFKKLRKRWLKSKDQLDVEEWLARHEWRHRFPKLRVYVHEIGAPHLVDPAKLLDSASRLYGDDMERLWGEVLTVPISNVVAVGGGERIEGARASAQEPLNRLAGTLDRWFESIVRYIRHRYTNGPTEGFNNKIKLIQRMAYGLRNEHHRRKRILAGCGKT